MGLNKITDVVCEQEKAHTEAMGDRFSPQTFGPLVVCCKCGGEMNVYQVDRNDIKVRCPKCQYIAILTLE
jgi:hypothetical protein